MTPEYEELRAAIERLMAFRHESLRKLRYTRKVTRGPTWDESERARNRLEDAALYLLDDPVWHQLEEILK